MPAGTGDPVTLPTPARRTWTTSADRARNAATTPARPTAWTTTRGPPSTPIARCTTYEPEPEPYGTGEFLIARTDLYERDGYLTWPEPDDPNADVPGWGVAEVW